jgi:hypothetical protein
MLVLKPIQNHLFTLGAGADALTGQKSLSVGINGAVSANASSASRQERVRALPSGPSSAPPRRSQSLPNMHIAEFETSPPDGENSLWRKDQPKFNEMRGRLLRFENSFTRKFTKEPDGTVINISVGNDGDARSYTQPTLRSCTLTSLLSVAHDLLSSRFEPGATVKEKFVYMIDNVLTEQERSQFFKSGFSLGELEEIANRTFKAFECNWGATAYSTPDTSFDKFSSLLQEGKQNRFVVNFCGTFLYGLNVNIGHFTHVDKIKIDENKEIYAHLVEHANYKFPANPWIPLPDLYKAMSQLGTDGKPRGFLVFAKKEGS